MRIDRIGAEGDGLARLPDGTPLFIPRALPTETITARLITPRGGGWHAVSEDITSPSPARVDPPCPHFARCGGCALQHWRDADYQAWKAGLLSRALRAAGFNPPEPLSYHPGLPGERRRIDFAVRRAEGRIILGLHAPRSRDVVDLTDCLILHPRLMAFIGPLRAALSELQCIRREASAIINLLGSGPDLLLCTDADPTVDDRTNLIALARAQDLPRVSVAVARMSAETICLLQPAVTTFCGTTVSPPPGAFLQATAAGEQAIIDAMLAGLPKAVTVRSHIAELYAGCGTLTFALASRARVMAFEGDADALAALRQAVNQAGLPGRIQPIHRDLVRQPLSAKELSAFAAVVLDPPATGAAAQIAQITAAAVPTVIYVSCNPATLSRDARTLRTAGYRLEATAAIDQFLWSPRLESVSVFCRS